MKTTKRRILTFLAALLTLSMLIATAMPTFAVEDEQTFSVWDGSKSETLTGEGTEESPILINSAADLAGFANLVNSGAYQGKYIYVELTTDIDLANKPWTPIGIWGGGFFNGQFDGKDHTIKGFFVSESSPAFTTASGSVYSVTDKAGLFGLLTGTMDKSIVIKNFTLIGEITTEKQRTENGVVITEKGGFWKAGSIAAIAVCTTVENVHCKVDIAPSYTSNVQKDGNGLIKGVDGQAYAGGIIADARAQINLNNCTYSGNIYFNFDKKNDVIVKETDNLATAINKIYVGGLIATSAINNAETYAGSTREIKNCTVAGSIDVTCHSNNSNTRVGGIVGAMMNGCLIESTHMLAKFNFKQTSGGKGACRVGYFVGGFGYSQSGAGLAKSSILSSTCVIPANNTSNLNSGATHGGAIGNSSTTDKLEITNYTAQTSAPDVKVRAIQTDTPANGTFNIRILSTLNSLDYTNVGYVVAAMAGAANGSIDPTPVNHVYTAINANNETVTAAELSNNEDAYIAAIQVEGVPATGEVSMVITPYVLATDGTTVIYGTATVITLVDGVLVNTANIAY